MHFKRIDVALFVVLAFLLHLAIMGCCFSAEPSVRPAINSSQPVAPKDVQIELKYAKQQKVTSIDADVTTDRVKHKEKDNRKEKHVVVQKPPVVAPTAPTSTAVHVSVVVPKDALHGRITRVADGDTVTFVVPVSSDSVPAAIVEKITQRNEARRRRDFRTADRLRDEIREAGYDYNDESHETVRSYRVRLLGVDAPETKMPMGPEAHAYLRALAENRSGYLRIAVAADRYGRVVADLYVCADGGATLWVQEQLLRQGWAWHYESYDQRAELARWQQEARAGRLGLWAQADPQPPWVWRQTHRRTD